MRYELWLDESGEFQHEQEKRDLHRLPSLVGGILLERSRARQLEAELDTLLDPERTHATELTAGAKRNYVLPVLETLRRDYGARQVFFENAEYEDGTSNRQLYLRVIAEGLIQLVQLLSAREGAVDLQITIARRMDVQTTPENRLIAPEEYRQELMAVYDRKRAEHRVRFHPDTRVAFHVRIASQEPKLQLADFACNTRLTRFSAAFQNCRDRVQALYDDALLFTLSEVTSENYIQLCLAQEGIADAVYELYTSQDELDTDALLEQILGRMKTMSYRLIKQQLKECEAQILGHLAYETDYEKGEAFLRRVIDGFAARLPEVTDAYPNLRFSLLLNLTDCFLREGSILEARDALMDAKQVLDGMDNCFENWLARYQYQEKLALYHIDSFAFRKAAQVLEAEGSRFRRILEALRFEKSEYYGDCLCMHIYALMFLQRREPELYGQLCSLSDLGLKQYPNNEGELERHRQYRSHIELEQGNFEEALRWLMKAKCWGEPQVNQEAIGAFLSGVVSSEEQGSQEYYLMYYLMIMARAALFGNPIAGKMYRALKKAPLFELLHVPQEDAGFTPISFEAPEEAAEYHPMEIVYWKYASYLAHASDPVLRQSAAEFYQRAIRLCLRQEHYLTMGITGIGVMAEYLTQFPDDKVCALLLKKQLESLTALPLDSETREFAGELDRLYKNGNLWELSERIAY